MASRVRFILGVLTAGGLLAGACSSVIIDTGPQRPTPSEPPTGTVVATAESGETTFVLYDEGEGCLAAEVRHPHLQNTVDRGCFDERNTLRETPSCGWLAEVGDSPETTNAGYGCDVSLPRVFYGRVADPAIGFVCVGRFDSEGGVAGVVGARILESNDDGFIFEVAGQGERTPPHFLSVGGSRFGDPPLDAPSDPIYRSCQAQAGVTQEELVYGIDLEVDLDEALRSDDITAFFIVGLDQVGVSGDANEGAATVLPVRVTPEVLRFEIEVNTAAGPIVNVHLEWPREVQDIVMSGESCGGITRVSVSIGAAVLDGDERAITVEFIGSDCASKRASKSASPQPPIDQGDAWEVAVEHVEDYEGADVEHAVSEIVRIESIIEATIDTLGDQNDGGRWCCENPPFTVTDVAIVDGERPRVGGNLNGVERQQLTTNVSPGDRVALFLSGGTALYVFDQDGGLVHPVAPHQAEAIEALRYIEALRLGYSSGADISPLDALAANVARFGGDWWGSVDHQVALALSGAPGHPTTCSASDLAPFVEAQEEPRSVDGLPDAVMETRSQLIAASVACDYTAVVDMILEPNSDQNDGEVGLDEFWWGSTATLEVFAVNDRAYGNLRSLVLALAFVPYGEVEGPQDDEAFDRYYTWPPDFGEVNSAQEFVDSVPEKDLAWMAAINGVTVEDLIESVDVFGGYALFRVGVAQDGEWMFALSGD